MPSNRHFVFAWLDLIVESLFGHRNLVNFMHTAIFSRCRRSFERARKAEKHLTEHNLNVNMELNSEDRGGESNNKQIQVIVKIIELKSMVVNVKSNDTITNLKDKLGNGEHMTCKKTRKCKRHLHGACTRACDMQADNSTTREHSTNTTPKRIDNTGQPKIVWRFR